MATFVRTGFERFWEENALNVGPKRCEIHLVSVIVAVVLVAAVLAVTAGAAKALVIGLAGSLFLGRLFNVHFMPKPANLVVGTSVSEPMPAD